MPFLDDNAQSIDLGQTIDVPKGFAVTPGASDLDPNATDAPRWNWAASFRQQNELAALASSESSWIVNDPEPGFNPWDKIKGTPDEVHFARLSEARNQRKFDAIRNDINQETEDKKVLASQPWWMSLVTEGAASIASPTTFLPGGSFVKGAKGGIELVKGAVSVGAAAGIATAAQETALHNIQQTRTVGESATAIGASMFLGGLLGGAGSLLSKGEWQKGVAALEGDLANPRPVLSAEEVLQAANSNEVGLRSVGAAANTAADIADNTIAGRAAQMTAAATAKMNPLLRILHSPSAEARDLGINLFENPLYLKKNFEGVASQPAVETLMKEYNGGLASSIKATNDAFLEHRKAGGQLSATEFREAVGKAMRRGDDAADPAVAKAAAEWRAKVFDPLKEQAIASKLLPEDVSVDTAASYFTRMWNGRAIAADEHGFKEMVEEYVGRQLEKEFAESVSSHSSRLARIDQEVADLQIPAEHRPFALNDLERKISEHEAQWPSLAEAADDLSDVRGQMVIARRGGDAEAVARLREEEKAIRSRFPGDAFTTFLKTRSDLRSRLRNTDFSAAGLNERSERIANAMEDTEEANYRAMQRLIRKGQKLARDLDRLDADAFEDRVNQIADSYAAVAKRAEASAARAEKTIENMKARALASTTRDSELAARATTEAKFGPADEAAGKRAIAKEAAVRSAAKRAAADAAVTKRLEVEAQRQRAMAEQMDKLSERLRAARDFDHDGLMDELRAGIDRVTRLASSSSMERGARVARLGERMAAVDPQKVADRIALLGRMKQELESKFIDRWEVGRGAVDVSPAKRQASFGDVAKQVSDEVFDTLTGRNGTARPAFITVKARGPLKERTFNIPDLFTAANGRAVENYLEHDVEQVGRRYTRIMGADVELARKFGSVDLRDQLQKIRDEYRGLRQGVTDEKRLKALGEREKADISDLESVRDLLRGTYDKAATETNYARIVRSVNHINYLRQMGEVAIASLSETVRPAMVHGLLPYMETLGQTMTNLKGIRMSVKEAQIAGAVTERVLGTRLATLSDIMDPYASRGPVEAFLENMTNIGSKWNGIRLLTDMQKAISAVMTQNRILRGVGKFAEVSPKERAYLAYLGIDESMAGRIAKQFAEHGETVDKVRVANQEKWTDEVAARYYRAAVSKDVDSIITTKGVADTPLFANTPHGRAMLQFQSFALASHQRVLLRGLQESQARFVGGTIAMTAIGIMATWLKAISANRTEKMVDAGKNPGWWIAEGFDKAGIFSVPVQLANMFEKASGFNPIKTPMKAFDEGSAISQKLQNRNLSGTFLGPTSGLMDDVAQVVGIPQKLRAGEEITQGQKNAAERLFPYNSYPGIRQMLRYVVNPQQ